MTEKIAHTSPVEQTVSTPVSERPDLGIETILPGEPVQVSAEQMPWLHEAVEVPTVRLRLETGEELQYGSVVGGNATLSKIASHVPKEKSQSVEAGLFKALPAWLHGDHPNIDVVMAELGTERLFKVGKNGKDAARLVFAKIQEGDMVTIVKVGISSHKDQQRMLGVMTGSSNRRRKKDG